MSFNRILTGFWKHRRLQKRLLVCFVGYVYCIFYTIRLILHHLSIQTTVPDIALLKARIYQNCTFYVKYFFVAERDV